MPKVTKTAPRERPGAGFDNDVKREWQARIEQTTGLAAMARLLIDFRQNQRPPVLRDDDFCWIEARMEEKTAVLRFEEMTPPEIQTQTLTGEAIAEVTQRYQQRAQASSDIFPLEELNREFREKYKPPIMPTHDFMRTETILAEQLMKGRNLDWYAKPLAQLRAERGARLLKAPKDVEWRPEA